MFILFKNHALIIWPIHVHRISDLTSEYWFCMCYPKHQWPPSPTHSTPTQICYHSPSVWNLRFLKSAMPAPQHRRKWAGKLSSAFSLQDLHIYFLMDTELSARNVQQLKAGFLISKSSKSAFSLIWNWSFWARFFVLFCFCFFLLVYTNGHYSAPLLNFTYTMEE